MVLSMSIPADKLHAVKNTCLQWTNKQVCMKNELQSLFGLSLYIAKCIKYARYILNRMLILENSEKNEKIVTKYVY